MNNEYLCQNTSQLKEIGEQLINKYPDKKVFAFFGEMGAGKTSLIKSICNDIFEVQEIVSSPTFSIVNQYLTSEGESIYHFDFYRIKNVEEAMDIGFDDYLYSDSYCFIEWPEKIEQLLPKNYVYVEIIVQDNESRLFKF